MSVDLVPPGGRGISILLHLHGDNRIDSPLQSFPSVLVPLSCSSLSSLDELLEDRFSVETYLFLLSLPDSVEISFAVSAGSTWSNKSDNCVCCDRFRFGTESLRETRSLLLEHEE